MNYLKKLILTSLICTIAILLVTSTANRVNAKVGDTVNAKCSVCHTMHNSQNGSAEYLTTTPALLRGGNASADNNASCVACHSGAASTTNGYDDITGAPQVDLLTTEILAGGTYGATGTGAESKMHNALGLAAPDTLLGTPNVPPGGDNLDIGEAAQITCAGTTGCHGNRAEDDNILAVHGAHHADDSTLTGSTVGSSYRFLSTDVVDDAFTASGAQGIEHATWESGVAGVATSLSTLTAEDATEHNVYVATDINLVCASCHGGFHGAINQDAPEPWLRHPTDITLSAAAASGPAEYANYPEELDGTNKYSLQAPVGYDAGDLGTTVAKGDGQVLCISCHRAHGSEYTDILRWDYDAMVAGDTVDTGCNRCHTTK